MYDLGFTFSHYWRGLSVVGGLVGEKRVNSS